MQSNSLSRETGDLTDTVQAASEASYTIAMAVPGFSWAHCCGKAKPMKMRGSKNSQLQELP